MMMLLYVPTAKRHGTSTKGRDNSIRSRLYAKESVWFGALSENKTPEERDGRANHTTSLCVKTVGRIHISFAAEVVHFATEDAPLKFWTAPACTITTHT